LLDLTLFQRISNYMYIYIPFSFFIEIITF
jgi:hypothetical protein